LAQQHKRAPASASNLDLEFERKQVHVLQLINAYRFRGHQQAQINPLDRTHNGTLTEKVDELTLKFHDLSEADFATVFETGSLAGPSARRLRKFIRSCATPIAVPSASNTCISCIRLKSAGYSDASKWAKS
jgi:2-oxoglutarate dehydrogenase complex dehydrogenase (E1) component-like enzyme